MLTKRAGFCLAAMVALPCAGGPTPPNPTTATGTASPVAAAYGLGSLASPGYLSGTFAFPLGRQFGCGAIKTIPAGLHTVTTTFSAGGITGVATGNTFFFFARNYASALCEQCQMYFLMTGVITPWTLTVNIRNKTTGAVIATVTVVPSVSVWTFPTGLTVVQSCTKDNTCPGCAPVPCPPGGGDCFMPGGLPGCEDEDCCSKVCGMEPFCCDVMWEPLCVDIAIDLCGQQDDDDIEPELGTAMVIQLPEFFSDITGTPPAGHPILDPADSLAVLGPWHLCLIQATMDFTAEQMETAFDRLVIIDADETVNTFDLAVDPDPFGISPADDFDAYAADSELHGQAGWKGWDDNIAAGAPVTQDQANSALQAAEIELDADLVHELCSTGYGAWSYSAWQYIPSDFVSGGGGAFDGSWFILLNTYNDGGPYNWSMQAQADSNDGLFKVHDGFGDLGGSVPYDTDRWVKIQTIIDLDDDWTRVYYDDELVTEYSWTGGVLGGGNGVLDIAAVDLFANGSTGVYYDDLKLEPIADWGGELILDQDNDGLTLLEETLLGTDPNNPDTDEDGALDGADNCPLDSNPNQHDADEDGVGDVCEPCPWDLDGDENVGIVDFLSLLAQWDTDPGGFPDFDGSGAVGITDFLELLANWGPCP